MARCRPRWPTGMNCRLADRGRRRQRRADQERAGVLEVVARNHPAERLAGRQRLAVAGIDVGDLALRHGHQPDLVDAELPPPQAEVDAAAEQVDLVAGLAVQGDDPAFGHRPLGRPEVLDDADLVIGDDAQPAQLDEGEHADDNGDADDYKGRRVGQRPRHSERGRQHGSDSR